MKLQKHTLGMVLVVLGLVLLAGLQDVLAQGLPTDSRTMVAVKGAMPAVTVESHEFTSDWKLERESGFTFSNLAKRAIKMLVRDNKSGQKRSFEGLAIYQRGATNDAWRWSRFFTYENTIKMIGVVENTAELERMTLESMTSRPSDYFGDLTGVYWAYPFKIVPGSFQKRSDTQMSWQVEVKLSRRWDHKFLVERVHTKSVDAYLEAATKTWKYAVGNDGEKELSRQEKAPSELDAMPNMQAKGFKALYGPK